MTDQANASFVKFVPATGEILCVGYCPAADLALQAEDAGVSVLEIAPGQPATVGGHYVESGAVMPRPMMPIARDGLSVTGVPAGAVVWIEGRSYPVDDGAVELSFAFAGTYRVRIECFPYQAAEFEVTA